MEEKFKIEIDKKEIVEIINKSIQDRIKEQLKLQSDNIDSSISEYFKKSFFKDKASQFDSSLDYSIEIAFRKGLEAAMEEMNFTEIIAKKAKEVLSDGNFIQDLAIAKVRSSLGLENLPNT